MFIDRDVIFLNYSGFKKEYNEIFEEKEFITVNEINKDKTKSAVNSAEPIPIRNIKHGKGLPKIIRTRKASRLRKIYQMLRNDTQEEVRLIEKNVELAREENTLNEEDTTCNRREGYSGQRR